MPRRVQRVAIGVAALAAVALVGLLLVATADLDAHRDRLGHWLSLATGRRVAIRGGIQLHLGLTPGLRIRDVSLDAPDAGAGGFALEIGQLKLGVAAWPLLRGRLELRELGVADASLRIEPASEGAGPDGAPSPPQPFDLGVTLRRVRVRELTLHYREAEGAEVETLAVIDRLRVDAPEGRGRVDVAAAGRLAGARFDLSAQALAAAPSPAPQTAYSIALDGRLAGARVAGRGRLAAPGQGRELELRLDVDAPSLASLAPELGRELPNLAPATARGVVHLRGGVLGLDQLEIAIGDRDSAWLELGGHVGDLLARRELALHADFGLADVQALRPLVGDPPDIGTVVGRATLSDRDGSPGIEEFTFRGGRPGVFEIDASGTFGDIAAVHELDARAQLKARDLAVIGELLHERLPAIGPLEFSARVTATDGKLVGDPLTARLDQTQLSGKLSGRFQPGRRPRLQASLRVPELHLDDLGIEPRGAPPVRAAEAHPPDAGRLFGDAPLPLERLRRADGELSLRIDRVWGVGGLLADGVELGAHLEDARLDIEPVELLFRGGRFSGALQLDARARPPRFAVHGRSDDVRLEQLVEQLDPRGVYSGAVDLAFDLRSRGDSAHALASQLEGEIGVFVRDGTIASEDAGLLTRDLIRALYHRPKPSQALRCLIADFQFESGDGTARTLLLDSEEILVVGSGSIDLADETLRLRFVPKPRHRSPLSTAPTVDVHGLLTRPLVSVQTRSLVTSAGKAVVHGFSALSGNSLLMNAIRSGAEGAGPCQQFLDAKP